MPQLDLSWFLINFSLAWFLVIIVFFSFTNQEWFSSEVEENNNDNEENRNTINEQNEWTW